MITLKIEVNFVEEVLGMANADPDIHRKYISEKAPNYERTNEEVEAINPDEEFKNALTIFHKDADGNPIVWDYQWKGFFKDAFGSLKKVPGSECSKIKAYKKEIDGLIFINPRKIRINLPEGAQVGICQRPLRANTPQGERIALASSETVPAGSSCIFEIQLLLDSHEDAVLEALEYGKLRGFGQWRNSGKGRFEYKVLDRIAVKGR